MTNDKPLNNQDLYKMRADLYLVQNALARTKGDTARKPLLEKKAKLERELVEALKKNSLGRQYCDDNKCPDMTASSTHVRHLSEQQES